ncbi:DUF488 domain-containing protein [Brachyspira intermedia]|uniref:DUF488 domain-containing protein n=1 Tax=Brachyspira intermedia TaxID=84377 RepID=UPI00300418A5
MIIYTIGFNQKSAKDFFYSIKNNNIEILIDIRLNNNSQLSGYTKNKDIEFFLSEISNCKYYHETIFAPTDKILKDYKKKIINWEEYKLLYTQLIVERNMVNYFIKQYSNYNRVCLLCAERTPINCHRNLLSHAIKEYDNNIKIIDI